MSTALETEKSPLDANMETVLPGVYQWHQDNQTQLRTLTQTVEGLQELMQEGIGEVLREQTNRTQESDKRLAIVFANIAAQLLGRGDVNGEEALAMLGLSVRDTGEAASLQDLTTPEDGMLTGTFDVTTDMQVDASPPVATTPAPIEDDYKSHSGFSMIHKHHSLSDLADEWFGTGKFEDAYGGIQGRNKLYGKKWRRHFKDKQLYSRTSRVIQAIETLAAREGLPIPGAVAQLENVFSKCNRSVANMVKWLQNNGLLATGKSRGTHKKKSGISQ